MRVLLVGGGAREHAIAVALQKAAATVIAVAATRTPGLTHLGSNFVLADPTSPSTLVQVAKAHRVDYAVIGPEAPLAAGVADALRGASIPVVGPDRAGAQIETSKRFCRELLDRHRVAACPRFQVVRNGDDVRTVLATFPQPFVVKPASITSGKGVWVQGADFTTVDEAVPYLEQVVAQDPDASAVLEEKLEGEEFSLMAFVTDSGIYPMPLVQDYKRALEHDKGRNTGGMGGYSQRDHLLPFLSRDARDQALDVLHQAVDALRAEGITYRGVLYGGFMQTAQGPRLLEFNARFGDPEGINVLTLYEDGDFDELLHGVAVGRVDPNLVRFRLRATVVKYLVPPGYGSTPKGGVEVTLDVPAIEETGVSVRYGPVEGVGPGRVRFSSSRGVALVGEASAIWEAGARVETALAHVTGEYYLRHDIGSKTDLEARLEHMRKVLSPSAKPSPLPLSVASPDAPPSSAAPPSMLLS
ncbi:MAG: phosphoribosylamine--glycine ligase [Thermoplasmata archaeon]